jgi:hypothetical protein
MGCAEPEVVEVRIGSRNAKRVHVFAALEGRTKDGPCQVIIHDLSATGARIEARLGCFSPGDIIDLRFPLLPTEQRGEVAWSAGGCAGVNFCASFDEATFRLLAHALRPTDSGPGGAVPGVPAEVPDAAPADEPKPRIERAEVAIGANCRTAAGRRGFVAMIDLTPQGCCLFGRDMELTPGQQLTLQPECLAGLKARVQWSKGSLTGVLFDHPLYPSVFEHLATTYPWPLSEPAKRALRPDGYISEAAQRELMRMIERAQKASNTRNAQQDVLATRPPPVEARPGTTARTINAKLARLFFG